MTEKAKSVIDDVDELEWSVPTHLERHPRPEGELERDWNEFVRRTGFPERRPVPKPDA